MPTRWVRGNSGVGVFMVADETSCKHSLTTSNLGKTPFDLAQCRAAIA